MSDDNEGSRPQGKSTTKKWATQQHLRRGTGNRPPNTADHEALIARRRRRQQAWDLKVLGSSYSQIGQALGISMKQAYRDVMRFSSELGRHRAEAQRNIGVARIDAALLDLNNAVAALRPHTGPRRNPATGELMVGEDGRPLMPDIEASRTLAIHYRTIARLEGERNMLLGLRVTKHQHEHTGEGGGPIRMTLDDLDEALSVGRANEQDGATGPGPAGPH